MAITIADLVAELKVFAPEGVELPRDIDDNEVREQTILRWAQDAAWKINEARGKTTIKQTTIETVAGQQDYALPADARTVRRIIREQLGRDSTVYDVPDQRTVIGAQPFGYLPSGQAISGALDLIGRQNLSRQRREDSYELFEGQLRLLFPIVAGETIRIEYQVVDRSLNSLPDDYFELVLTYLRWKALDWFLGKHGAGIISTGDSLADDSMAVLNRQMHGLERQWIAALNAIQRESA